MQVTYADARDDSPEAPLRFGDVVELVRPRHHETVHDTWRDDLYPVSIERRHGRWNSMPAGVRRRSLRRRR